MFSRLFGSTSSSHWLLVVFSFRRIGLCDYFGFDFSNSIENRSKSQIAIYHFGFIS